MKGGSVLAHVTDWNDEADEESAPFCRAKRGFFDLTIAPTARSLPLGEKFDALWASICPLLLGEGGRIAAVGEV